MAKSKCHPAATSYHLLWIVYAYILIFDFVSGNIKILVKPKLSESLGTSDYSAQLC